MKKLKLDNEYFGFDYWHEASKLYENGDEFEFELNDSYDHAQKLTIELINLLLKKPEFIMKNALITKQFPLADYFIELHGFIKSRGEKHYLVLQSETYNKIYLRAYFTEKDLKRMEYFRSYNEETFDPLLDPDINFDIRVVRRASMELLFKNLYSDMQEYKQLDLNKVCLWDYGFAKI